MLASYRDPRCKNSIDTIEKSLTGNYRDEHIFSLKQALEIFDVYQEKINACDDEIEKCLFQFESRVEISAEELSKRITKRRASDKNAPLSASAFRMAASTLHRSDSALGAFLRRLKSRLGPGKAIAATAHKLAVIIFNMLKRGVEYIETGQDYYEKQYREK